MTQVGSEPPYPRRHAHRLADYDYGQAGAYFVTVCTHRRVPFLGKIQEGGVILSNAGRIVDEELKRTPSLRPYVVLDAYVVMPNHVHAILFLEERRQSDTPIAAPAERRSLASPAGNLGAIVRGFKGAASGRIRELSGMRELRVWQSSYYDHVIRNERDLSRIREYIENNALSWELDRYYRAQEEADFGIAFGRSPVQSSRRAPE